MSTKKKIMVSEEVYNYLEGLGGENAENGLKQLIQIGLAVWTHAEAFDPLGSLVDPEQISDAEIDKELRKWTQ